MRRAKFAAVSGLFLSLFSLAVSARQTEKPGPASTSTMRDATNHLGRWMWDSVTRDKQTCRFWKSFSVPEDFRVTRAHLLVAADNGYTLYLDGRELGRGSDWRTISDYDLTWLLPAGAHVLAVEGFNDNDKAGVILGLHIVADNGKSFDVASDTSWKVVPDGVPHWEARRRAAGDWPAVTIVGQLGQEPWWKEPTHFVTLPAFQPQQIRFWERGWFQMTALIGCGLGVLSSIYLMMQLAMHSRAQRLLYLERARIARDIHDDLGARLTQLLLTGEEAQSKLPPESEARGQFDQMCDGARNVLGAIDEVVWVVNSQRDTLSDFVIYICKYAEAFLRAAQVRCRFDIQRELPGLPLDLPFRRNLLLTIKEALSNSVKHSGASEVSVRMRLHGKALITVVEDNGRGFEAGSANPLRHGLANMAGRMEDLGGQCRVVSAPGEGCRIEFEVPLPSVRLHRWSLFRPGIVSAQPAGL